LTAVGCPSVRKDTLKGILPVVTDPAIGDDEWVLLTWFYTVGWDSASFGELRTVGGGASELIPRIQVATRRMVERGWATVEVRSDFEAGQPVQTTDALAAVDDASNWRAPYDEGFDGSGSFFAVVPTDEVERVYRAECEAGREYVDPAVLR
jgi:hypothetical protein